MLIPGKCTAHHDAKNGPRTPIVQKRRPGVVTTWKMASHRQAGSGRRDALLRSQCYEPVCFGLALPAPPPCGESARGESGLLAPALSGRDVSEIDSEAAE